jgi:hypothetical protein
MTKEARYLGECARSAGRIFIMYVNIMLKNYDKYGNIPDLYIAKAETYGTMETAIHKRATALYQSNK